MKCETCENQSEGYAVTPGVGEAGEIRFFCDTCARRDRVKMRYWDGRDLEVGGWRENADLGDHFHTLIFAFEDFSRMRREDLVPVMDWAEDGIIAAALSGASKSLQKTLLGVLPKARAAKVRSLLRTPPSALTIKEARKKLANLVKRL